MARLIGGETDGDITTTWHHDEADDRMVVRRQQDIQSVIDNVSAVNANGVQTTDGMGRPVIEMPVVLAMDWCEKRGIPWERFMYSTEYDAEWKRFAFEHSKLAYQATAKHHAVTK